MNLFTSPTVLVTAITVVALVAAAGVYGPGFIRDLRRKRMQNNISSQDARDLLEAVGQKDFGRVTAAIRYNRAHDLLVYDPRQPAVMVIDERLADFIWAYGDRVRDNDGHWVYQVSVARLQNLASRLTLPVS